MDIYFHPFVIPFSLGVLIMLGVLIYKYANWFADLTSQERGIFFKSIFTRKTLISIKECVTECLLHLKIYRVNLRLGYMHMSLALGWFLLILVGWLETAAILSDQIVPLYVHVFFRFFVPVAPDNVAHVIDYAPIMDALLLIILISVALAVIKRFKSTILGMRKATKHTLADHFALTSLWLIFPVRLLAESATCGIHRGGSFLTYSVGSFLSGILPIENLELPLWWLYSIVLCVFMVSLPFSRYLHIFAEIPHIFLKNYNIRPKNTPSAIDKFQIAACSRCGICIDPCQMQSSAGVNNMQSVYFLRDCREGNLTQKIADNCLMCGRCEQRCPVGIDLNSIRLNRRQGSVPRIGLNPYGYASQIDTSQGSGKVGYFAGCMTTLSPRILHSMERIFKSANEQVWWADRDGGICCGRPLMLAGDIEGAKKMMQFNSELFHKHQIETLVTSCPICLKVFKEEYKLQGIRVLHHSEYIEELIAQKRLQLEKSARAVTYHDPCELGRGCGIYTAPRNVIESVAILREATQNSEQGLCCGASLANTVIETPQVYKIATDAAAQFESTGAEMLVTACPLCKKSFAKVSHIPVKDLSELVSESIKADI